MPHNHKEEPAPLPLSQEKAESVCPQKELSKAYLLLLKDKYNLVTAQKMHLKTNEHLHIIYRIKTVRT